MENNTRGTKAKNFLQKMYNLRLKVDKQGKPIVNVSSIFGLACLLFAPHMTIAGIAISLILGYQIHFESEEDDGEMEEKIRRAAMNVKAGVAGAAKSIQNEINRAREERANAAAQPRNEAAPKQAEAPRQQEPGNDELLRELEERAKENTESNPAATTFHSAYAASAGSVPVLKVSEETAKDPGSAPAAGKAQE